MNCGLCLGDGIGIRASLFLVEHRLIYGPYWTKDNRQIITINGKTESYPRFLLKSVGVTVSETDIVHHKDGNPSNNNLDNLEVLTQKEHMIEHHAKYAERTDFSCPSCGSSFTLSRIQMQRRTMERNRGKAITGPYCSRSCAGRLGRGHN